MRKWKLCLGPGLHAEGLIIFIGSDIYATCGSHKS
jgi:hypothetical protein